MALVRKKLLLRLLFEKKQQYLVHKCKHFGGDIYVFRRLSLNIRIKHMPVTVIISKKVEKKAVIRNKIRRIIKLFVGKKLRKLDKYDKLFVVVRVKDLKFLNIFKILFNQQCLEKLEN